jgi:hypothetical protein
MQPRKQLTKSPMTQPTKQPTKSPAQKQDDGAANAEASLSRGTAMAATMSDGAAIIPEAS